MKRHIFLLVLTCFYVLPLLSSSTKQIEKVKIDYSLEKESEKEDAKYALKISIENSATVDVYLYISAPQPDNLVFESKKTNKKEIQIKKLDTGSYTLIIYESDNKAVIEKINIGNPKNE